MKIGSDHLEWYDLKYWIDKFGLTIGKGELLELYEDEIEVLILRLRRCWIFWPKTMSWW